MVSIVVPVYNGEKFLKECIDSVKSQSCGDWELIIIDDGSTDSSAKIAQSYLNDSRIRLIVQKNSGVAFSRMAGVKLAKGEWITFLDADDVLSPVTISTLLNNVDTTTDIISFGIKSFPESEAYSAESCPQHTHTKRYLPNEIPGMILVGRLLSSVCGNMYRRDLVANNTVLMCNGLKIGEDTMFNFELSMCVPLNVKYLGFPLYGYRENPKSVTRAIKTERFDAIANTISYIRNYMTDHPQTTRNLHSQAAFRILLLWSTFMFHPENQYYSDKILRRQMRKSYFKAFPYLYPYLKAYLFIDLFVSKKISQHIIQRKHTSY